MGRKRNNCFEVYAVDRVDGFAWHTTQVNQSDSSSGFGEWLTGMGIQGLGQIAIGSNSDGLLGVFAIQRK
ncbi:hypothetical protein KSC_032650 [Ktedonobacter sp. SOSP1-52]|nr:hypothetical protein KSC_032650 [Ktedonobacter sp. SOSP1-52]